MTTTHVVTSLSKLEQLLGKNYDIANRKQFDEYLFAHPLRFTSYLLQQIKTYPSIAKQYIPDPRELNPVGKKRTLTGVMRTGVAGLERLYLDRVILMPSPLCFAYCRFCFRKDYSHNVQDQDFGNPQSDFKEAFEYIRKDDRIKEVLITGGDPLLFPEKTIQLIRALREIPHLDSIRIGTRIFTSDPEKVTEEWIQAFKEFNKVNLDTNTHSIPAPISIAPHINHPDELSSETEKALLRCTQNNIPLYNQTVFLKEINDDPHTLLQLFRRLRKLGVENYRVYHADPLEGTEHFRTTLESFMKTKRWLRAHASGRVVPNFIVDTQLGKIELGADADVLKREGRYLWIRTPFTIETFRSVVPDWRPPKNCEVDNEGYLIVQYEDSIDCLKEQESATVQTMLKILD